MADFDFTGLTEAHRHLLDRGGWTVAEASSDNVQPSARQVAKLIEREHMTCHKRGMSQPRRIESALPRPTLSQRVRSMSDSELIMAAGGLSQRTDAASAEALRAVTAETQRRGFRL